MELETRSVGVLLGMPVGSECPEDSYPSIALEHSFGLISRPPSGAPPHTAPGSNVRWQPYTAGGPILRPVSVSPKPCVSLQMGIDFTVENLSKSQPNAAPFLPTSHHPHSYDFAIPIRGAISRMGALACKPAAGVPVSAHHREMHYAVTRLTGGGLLQL